MKIECPECKLSGNIDDSTVPATGLAMTCPRCKKQFTAERPASPLGGAVLDSCPTCSYATFSEEKFAVCPKCGLVVADYHKLQLAARNGHKSGVVAPPSRGMSQQNIVPLSKFSQVEQNKEEEVRRKYGLNKITAGVEAERYAVTGTQVETPLSILIAGWGTIIVSALLMVNGGYGIMEYFAKLKEAKAALEALDDAPSRATLFFQFLLFPVLSLVFSAVMLFFGTQFFALRRWSVNAMRNGALVGVGLLALMKVSDMIFWFKRASADASIGYYAMGAIGDFLMMILLIAPFLALAEYLRSSLFEEIDDLFS